MAKFSRSCQRRSAFPESFTNPNRLKNSRTLLQKYPKQHHPSKTPQQELKLVKRTDHEGPALGISRNMWPFASAKGASVKLGYFGQESTLKTRLSSQIPTTSNSFCFPIQALLDWGWRLWLKRCQRFQVRNAQVVAPKFVT